MHCDTASDACDVAAAAPTAGFSCCSCPKEARGHHNCRTRLFGSPEIETVRPQSALPCLNRCRAIDAGHCPASIDTLDRLQVNVHLNLRSSWLCCLYSGADSSRISLHLRRLDPSGQDLHTAAAHSDWLHISAQRCTFAVAVHSQLPMGAS